MTNEEMIKGLFESNAFKTSLLAISQHGKLNEESVAAAIPDYYQTAAAATARLFEMKIHEYNPFHNEDNAKVPYLILGQLGSVPGAALELILHLCVEESIEVDAAEEYIESQVKAGNEGTPNLVHGILHMEAIGSYMTSLRDHLFLSAMARETDDVMNSPVTNMFPEVH